MPIMKWLNNSTGNSKTLIQTSSFQVKKNIELVDKLKQINIYQSYNLKYD